MHNHEGTAGYLCDDCGKAFTTRQKLQNHRRAKHTFEKPYICDQCGRGFTRYMYSIVLCHFWWKFTKLSKPRLICSPIRLLDFCQYPIRYLKFETTARQNQNRTVFKIRDYSSTSSPVRDGTRNLECCKIHEGVLPCISLQSLNFKRWSSILKKCTGKVCSSPDRQLALSAYTKSCANRINLWRSRLSRSLYPPSTFCRLKCSWNFENSCFRFQSVVNILSIFVSDRISCFCTNGELTRLKSLTNARNANGPESIRAL